MYTESIAEKSVERKPLTSVLNLSYVGYLQILLVPAVNGSKVLRESRKMSFIDINVPHKERHQTFEARKDTSGGSLHYRHSRDLKWISDI